MKSEIFHSSKTIPAALSLLQKRVNDGSITESEQKLIAEFLQDRKATQKTFGGAKAIEYVSGLTHFRRAGYVKTEWHKISKKELTAAISAYKSMNIRYFDRKGNMHERDHGYAANTLNTDIRAVITWLYWLIDSKNMSSDLTRADVEKIKYPSYRPKEIKQENMYSEEMISKLVEIADPMLKALVWTQYETGSRLNEVCDLRWGDIEWRDKGAKVRIRDSKQDQIRFAFISMHSVSLLRIWRNMYPVGDAAGDDYVFLNKINRPLKYGVASRIVESLQWTHIDGKRVRRMPKFTCHEIRDWRATNLTKQGVSQAAISMQLWNKPKAEYYNAYARYSAEDSWNEIAALNGAAEHTPDQKPLDINYCPYCAVINPPGVKFCNECGMALTREAMSEVERVRLMVRKGPGYKRALIEELNKGDE